MRMKSLSPLFLYPGFLSVISVLLMAALGCGSSGSSGTTRAASKEPFVTVDGLRKTPIDMPGALFLREDHSIGSYDAFIIPPAQINYKRRSRKLESEMEKELLATLEQSLIELASEADIPISLSRGPCVMQIGLALYNVEFARSNSAETIGQMTLVMEFRDSISGTPLLRYATQNRIERERGGMSRSTQIRRSFDDMMIEMNVGRAMNAAGLTNQEIRAECNGTLAKRGAASANAGSER